MRGDGTLLLAEQIRKDLPAYPKETRKVAQAWLKVFGGGVELHVGSSTEIYYGIPVKIDGELVGWAETRVSMPVLVGDPDRVAVSGSFRDIESIGEPEQVEGERRVDPNGNTMVKKYAWPGGSAKAHSVTICDIFGGHETSVKLEEWNQWPVA